MRLVTNPAAVKDAFVLAAIDWAAGGRGQPLVDAAARALAEGLDTPSLRLLAGVSRFAADDDARELAPQVFEELEMTIRPRLSADAIVEGARQRARGFLAGHGAPRTVARELSGMYVSAGYPEELAVSRDWTTGTTCSNTAWSSVARRRSMQRWLTLRRLLPRVGLQRHLLWPTPSCAVCP